MNVLEHELTFAVLGGGLASLLLSLWTQFNVHLKLRAERLVTNYQPPISILKPLRGLDDALYDNLASLARQNYPSFELLFGVRDWDDPAVPVVRKLQSIFPQVPIRLVAQHSVIALNPKVNTLLRLISLAHHEHVLISDSNVSVDPNYLSAMVAEMTDPKVAMVSSVIAGTGEESLGAALENLHLCAFVTAMACSADRVGDPLVIGKSMLMRRSVLEEAGGLWSVRDILAEDYVLGQRFHALGHSVVLSSHAITTVNQTWTLQRFLSRHLRWAQLRRWGTLPHFLAEPLAYPIPILSLAAAMSYSSGLPSILVYSVIAGIVIKVASDAAVTLRIRRRLPSLLALVLTPLKDCAMIGLWAVAAVRRTVEWRGHQLRIGPGTALQRTRELDMGVGEMSARVVEG